MLCISCLTAGVILQIFEKDSAKRCIKAVAGLYILVAVLQGCGDFEQNLQTWSTAQADALTLPTEQEYDFSANLLTESSAQLSKRYSDVLLAKGVVAQVVVEMQNINDTINVASVAVWSDEELTAQQKNDFAELLKTELNFEAIAIEYFFYEQQETKPQE